MADRVHTDRPGKAIGITVGVALVCALLVSLTSVGLRPRYLANLEAEQRVALRGSDLEALSAGETKADDAEARAAERRMARLGSVLDAVSGTTGKITAGDIEAHVVELASGRYSEELDPEIYDQREAATDPEMSVAIPRDLDIARIKRRVRYATVYIVRDSTGSIKLLILPIRGSGYQSALYAYLAVDKDASTVLALKIYEQKETPGMGARVQEPAWESSWAGKRITDETGEIRIGVARGNVAPGSDDAAYLVDGISGATRTSMGVHGMVRFWLGDFGFRPYLERVRRGEI